MVLELITWWYGQGWLQAVKQSVSWLRKVERNFSLGILLRTLFAPWKQIISSPGDTPGDKLRALSDNLISRIVGACVRLLSLMAFLLLGLITLIASLVWLIIWPLLPIAALFSLFKGIVG